MSAAEFLWDLVKFVTATVIPFLVAGGVYWHTKLSEAKLELSGYLENLLFRIQDYAEANYDGTDLLLEVRLNLWPEIYRLVLRRRFWSLDRRWVDKKWAEFQNLSTHDTTDWPEISKRARRPFKNLQDLWNRLKALDELT